MTTGRINQVTTIQPRERGMTVYSRRSAFRRLVFVTRLSIFAFTSDRTRPATVFLLVACERTNSQASQILIPLFPDLTSFRPALLVRSRTKITAFSEDYQQPAAPERCAQSRRIPEWLFAIKFGHRQVIHILQQRRHSVTQGRCPTC